VTIKSSTSNKYAVWAIIRVKVELKTNVSQTSASMSTLLKETEEISGTLIFKINFDTADDPRRFLEKMLSSRLGEGEFVFSKDIRNKYLNVSVPFHSSFTHTHTHINTHTYTYSVILSVGNPTIPQ
jgi:hypothetical protein